VVILGATASIDWLDDGFFLWFVKVKSVDFITPGSFLICCFKIYSGFGDSGKVMCEWGQNFHAIRIREVV